jgi:rhodanese-related sulfurtransferase
LSRPMPNSVDDLLEQARAKLHRVQPTEAARAVAAGDAVLIDIRGSEQIAAQGSIPGARWIPRNVLEWRLAPPPAERVILICAEGFQSSLAAATLQELGCADATDVIGGFEAWTAAGLPVERD